MAKILLCLMVFIKTMKFRFLPSNSPLNRINSNAEQNDFDFLRKKISRCCRVAHLRIVHKSFPKCKTFLYTICIQWSVCEREKKHFKSYLCCHRGNYQVLNIKLTFSRFGLVCILCEREKRREKLLL